MPTLNWIGKEAVIDRHCRVPLRLLECDPALSAGDPDAGNLLVQGDNLEALKALLPRYKGQVKCIYIAPRLPSEINTAHARRLSACRRTRLAGHERLTVEGFDFIIDSDTKHRLGGNSGEGDDE